MSPAPQPPPRSVRLAPHRTVLRLGPSTRMIGLDPAAALVVDDLTPPLARMLDALAAPADRDELARRAVHGGADPEQADALLRHLLDAGAVVDAGQQERRARRRAESVAHVRGNGPLAVGVATGLALGGVGAVHVSASGTVEAADLGTGYRDADRGHDRAPAAAAAVLRVAPAARTGPLPQRVRPDLVVLADTLVPDAAALMADGTAHLPVRLRDGVGAVGPLVLPGRSPCLRCLDLHRLAHERAWPRVAAVLAGRCGGAAPECVVATAALGTAQALAALDGGAAPPPALGATLAYDPATATIERRQWARHPDCLCHVSNRTTVACRNGGGRGTIGS